MRKKNNMGLHKNQLRRIESDVAKKMVVLSAAYLMDEFDYDEQKIIDYYNGLTRYCDAINEKLISVKKVREIIEEKTGLKM